MMISNFVTECQSLGRFLVARFLGTKSSPARRVLMEKSDFVLGAEAIPSPITARGTRI